MDANDLQIRLMGSQAPSGEIDLDDLGRIASSLQELSTRVGRFVVGLRGPGRTPDAAAKIVGLRLSGLAAGSTVLRVSFGEHDVLPIGADLETEIAARFWEIAEGVAANARPTWVEPTVAESALRLVDALTGAASDVEITRGDGGRVTWARQRVLRDTWRMPRISATEHVVTVAGRLEKVDLADRKFRIRDDVGNTIPLDQVVDADRVGPLVGQRTEARGVAVVDGDGHLIRLTSVTIEASPLPPEWAAGGLANIEVILAAAPGPDPGGVRGVTDQDIDDLLAAIDR